MIFAPYLGAFALVAVGAGLGEIVELVATAEHSRNDVVDVPVLPIRVAFFGSEP